jgi:hypothetical protein
MLTRGEAPVRIRVSGCAPEGAGRWRVTFVVCNRFDEPLELRDAWLPHGRFRGDGHMALDASIPPGDEYVLGLGVSATEERGTLVENAFLILRVHGSAERWRVFARMRITFDDVPRPLVEAVTAQRLLQ